MLGGIVGHSPLGFDLDHAGAGQKHRQAGFGSKAAVDALARTSDYRRGPELFTLLVSLTLSIGPFVSASVGPEGSPKIGTDGPFIIRAWCPDLSDVAHMISKHLQALPVLA